MKCAGCNQERDNSGNCSCAKCHSFWPVRHNLPRIHWSAGKLVRGQHYEVFPPLLHALMQLRPRDVMIEPGTVMLCVNMCRNWDRIMPRAHVILNDYKLLQFNGAISATRKPNCKVLWVNHHQCPSPAMRRYVRGPRKLVWTDYDLDDFLTVTFMPRLIKLLLECHNVGRIWCFDEGHPGITIAQKFAGPWSRTLTEILEVLKDGFVERYINPPEPGSCYDVPRHLWNPAWKWNPPYAHEDARDGDRERRLLG